MGGSGQLMARPTTKPGGHWTAQLGSWPASAWSRSCRKERSLSSQSRPANNPPDTVDRWLFYRLDLCPKIPTVTTVTATDTDFEGLPPGAEMEADSLFTWKPSPGDSNHLESPDSNAQYNDKPGFFQRVFATVLNPRTGRNPNTAGQRRFFPRFPQRQGPGRFFPSQKSSMTAGQGKYPWWTTLGPALESTKINGNYLKIPQVAPPTAPGEHKKVILTETLRKLENLSADWTAKTDFLFERFSGVCANAHNEAELRLTKLEDFTSDVYEFSSPVGLTNSMEETQIAFW